MSNSEQGLIKVPARYIVKSKPKTDDEIKEYHRKRLYELSLKSLGEVPQLEEPSYEQMQWFNRKMKAPAWAWRSFA